jgi:hypothetical protein
MAERADLYAIIAFDNILLFSTDSLYSVQIRKNDTANYYLGISFLKLNKPDSALIDLKKIDKNSKYYNRANYYLALSYLLTNKKDSCINILKSFQFNNLAMQANRNTILSDIK